jgi:acyl-CoA thioesterase YciA
MSSQLKSTLEFQEDLTNRRLSIKSVMLPKDTNALGSIFGGHILSLIDLAASEHARSLYSKRFVTKVFREVNFIAPVFVGDTVSFFTSTVKLGRTSITIGVAVEAEGYKRRGAHISTSVTSAEIIMVAVDESGNPIPLTQ